MTHAALLREMIGCVRAAGVTARKIAAHVDKNPNGLLDEIDDLVYIGNSIADNLSGDAAETVQVTPQQARLYDECLGRWVEISSYATAIYAAFLRAHGQLGEDGADFPNRSRQARHSAPCIGPYNASYFTWALCLCEVLGRFGVRQSKIQMAAKVMRSVKSCTEESRMPVACNAHLSVSSLPCHCLFVLRHGDAGGPSWHDACL